MKHVNKVLTLAGVTMLVSACSTITGEDGYLRDQGGDYIHEEMSPGLTIPESLDAKPTDDYLIVPDITSDAPVDSENVPRADRRIIQDDGVAYQLVQQTDGGRVLLIERSPAVVWSFLNRFWSSNDIPVISQNITAGVMETDWVQLGEKSNPGMMRQLFGKVIDLENSEVNREKFRVTLRSGEKSGSSQVLLQHARRSINDDTSSVVDWDRVQAGVSSIDNQLLNEMMMFMVQNRQVQTAAVVSEAINIVDQTSLSKDGNGIPVLNIGQGFARSWQAVEQALQKSGAYVTDKNRTAGLIYVSLSEGKIGQPVAKEKQESGWFSGLLGNSDDAQSVKEAADNEYRLRIRGVGDNTQVTLEKDLNTLPPAGLSEKFLEQLRNNLS